MQVEEGADPRPRRDEPCCVASLTGTCVLLARLLHDCHYCLCLMVAGAAGCVLSSSHSGGPRCASWLTWHCCWEAGCPDFAVQMYRLAAQDYLAAPNSTVVCRGRGKHCLAEALGQCQETKIDCVSKLRYITIRIKSADAEDGSLQAVRWSWHHAVAKRFYACSGWQASFTQTVHKAATLKWKPGAVSQRCFHFAAH